MNRNASQPELSCSGELWLRLLLSALQNWPGGTAWQQEWPGLATQFGQTWLSEIQATGPPFLVSPL